MAHFRRTRARRHATACKCCHVRWYGNAAARLAPRDRRAADAARDARREG